MDGSFHVHGEPVGARPRRTLRGSDRVRDHEVRLQRQPGDPPECADHERSDRDVGDEVPVHHVDVDPVGARRFHLGDLLAEAREVGGEDRRREGDRAHDRARVGEILHRIDDVLRGDSGSVEQLGGLARRGHVAHGEMPEALDLTRDAGLRERGQHRVAEPALDPVVLDDAESSPGGSHRVDEGGGIDRLHGIGVDHADLDRRLELDRRP